MKAYSKVVAVGAALMLVGEVAGPRLSPRRFLYFQIYNPGYDSTREECLNLLKYIFSIKMIIYFKLLKLFRH